MPHITVIVSDRSLRSAFSKGARGTIRARQAPQFVRMNGQALANAAEELRFITVTARDTHRFMLRFYIRRLYRLLHPLLFARSQFKLFLNASLGDINLRVLALASVTDYFASFVRPVVIRAPFGKSALVIAPHQDDEAIGCGGALVLQIRAGQTAAIVMLTDGAEGHDELGFGHDALMDLRNEESRRAATTIGVEAPVFLNHANLAEKLLVAAGQVRDEILRRKADAVFIPFVLDGHPDHRAANYILAEALKGVSWNVRVLQYEVWGLCIPNVVLIIDDVIDDKIRMISCFTWANKAIDYVQSTVGLNMYHSKMLGAGECRYAERYFELPRKEYIELVEKVRSAAIPPTLASLS
jgi:LmbE family N-acetylglucosaminyl deacetylase